MEYNFDVMRPAACYVLNTSMVYSYAFLFECITVGRISDSMKVPT